MRTVACRARLRIITNVARAEETSPTQLAQELGMGTDLVSAHLTRLTFAGLITRRRSGVRCHCAAGSPYPAESFSGKISAWLNDAVGRPKRTIRDPRVARPKTADPSDPDAELHTMLIDAATALTNVRRVQILRRLCGAEVLAVETLSRDLGVSASAVSRHTSKLIRRGYVNGKRAGRFLEYRLADSFKTPWHARLLQILRQEWEKPESQSFLIL
jgi:DNA-binding transcriptional ArsR family regulator